MMENTMSVGRGTVRLSISKRLSASRIRNVPTAFVVQETSACVTLSMRLAMNFLETIAIGPVRSVTLLSRRRN